MLAVVGAVNLVGRYLAKRAAAEERAEQAAGTETPAAAGPKTRSVPARAVKKVAPAPPAAPPVVRAPKASAASMKVSTPARSVRAALPVTAARAAPASAATKQGEPRKRWNARTLRRAFVASEIFGTPVGKRS